MSKKTAKKKAEKKPVKVVSAGKPGKFLARVYVSLKPTVNDPEGITIGGALSSLGFDSVTGVRAGRYFQLTLNAADARAAATEVDQMCSRLLANPVIETYSFEIEKS